MSDWQNITETCAIVPDSTSGEFALEVGGCDQFLGYRLRKVRVDELFSHPDEPSTTWVFIVEHDEAERTVEVKT